jgi:aminoglycoside 3-N-acetyltransferase
MKSLWTSLGLTKQDTVLIQANCVHLIRKYNTTPKEILESILDTVGTAVFPTFLSGAEEFVNNGFSHWLSPSKMGVLSETARLHSFAVRSGHPIYSFVSIGCNSSQFDINNFSGYSKDSPFGVLRRLNGKVMVIGLVNSQGCSILHHAEQLCDVPYRIHKRFTGEYTDKHGKTEERTYGFFCNGGYKTVLDPIDDLIWKEGLYRGNRPYEGDGVRVIGANEITDFTMDLIKQGNAKGILYDDRS